MLLTDIVAPCLILASSMLSLEYMELIKYNSSDIVFGLNISTWRFSINQNTYLQSNLNIKIFNGTLNCNHCNYTARNYKSDSTPRDLLITGASKKTENLNLLLRTLRHTGCKCTVAILLDEEALQSLTKDMILDIELCGGQIINMGKPEYTMENNHYTNVYLWTYYIAKRNYHRFDRIMKVDMFDTLFQGDPFSSTIEPSKFYMIDEARKMFYNAYHYILMDLGIKPKSDESLICSGIAFGDSETFTRALDVYFKYFIWHKKWFDQHVFNVLYTYDLYKYHNVDLVELRPNETIRHLYAYRTDGEIGTITGIFDNNNYATVIHHTHVAPILLESMNKYCPNNNPEIKNYVTKFRNSSSPPRS